MSLKRIIQLHILNIDYKFESNGDKSIDLGSLRIFEYSRSNVYDLFYTFQSFKPKITHFMT